MALETAASASPGGRGPPTTPVTLPQKIGSLLHAAFVDIPAK
jgi:hypothetical protein